MSQEKVMFEEDLPPGFLTHPALYPQDDGRTWVTAGPLRWKNGRVYQVPKWFVTDFASVPVVIPSLLTLLISWGASYYVSDLWAAMLAVFVASHLGLTPFGRHQLAAVLHDYLYYSGEVSRAEADRVFRYAMADKGVFLTKRWAMWASVRCFGWMFWKTTGGTNRVMTEEPRGKARTGERGLDRLFTLVKMYSR